MTRFNKKLEEKPDHGHYAVCLSRKLDIDRNATQLLKYTLSMCIGMIICTIFMLRFAVISWIPSLLGESTEVAPLFTQLLIIALIALLAMLNCGRWKICGVILTGIFAAMVIFGNIGLAREDSSTDLITVLLGAFGIVRSFMSVPDYLDWKQLSETEGFPLFNIRFAVQNDNPDYVPVHTGEDASDQMSAPEQVNEMPFGLNSQYSEMPALTAPKINGKSIYTFDPSEGKHCEMSESPIKTA